MQYSKVVDEANEVNKVNEVNEINVVNELNEVNKVNKVNKVNTINEANAQWILIVVYPVHSTLHSMDYNIWCANWLTTKLLPI